MSTTNETLPVPRGTLTVLLGMFAALWLGAAGYSTYRTATGWGKPAVLEEGAKPTDPPKVPAVPADPNAGLFLATAALTAAGTLCAAAGLLYHVTAVPPLTGPQMRKLILQVGVASGGLLILIGLWYLLALFDYLVAWLERGEIKTAWKVLVPILIALVGAGVAFASTLPARAVERTDGGLRRVVYGANAGIALAVLFFGLVVANVVAASKLPNKLDTTAGGFYTLQPKTQQFVEQLETPFTLHVLTPDSTHPLAQEIRRLVLVVRDANPAKVTVKFENTRSETELDKLRKKFPAADVESSGVIVAVGADGDRYSLIRFEDFAKQDTEGGARSRMPTFQGEVALMKELVFLTEGKVKPVIYFTQGHGELALAANPELRAAPARTMEKMKGFLEKQNYECRPLDFGPGKDPAVPDDASVVVVADPRAAFEKPAEDALRKYLKEKKGKLFVASSPKPVPAGGGIETTGLKGLLGDYNLGFGDFYLYAAVRDPLTPRDLLAEGLPQGAAVKFGPAASQNAFVLPDCRPVSVARNPANAGVETVPVFSSQPGVPTWIESAELADPLGVITAVMNSKDRAAIQKKQLTDSPRILAAVARDGGVGKVVALGSGQMLSDDFARKPAALDAGPIVAGTLDYLRERKEVPDVLARPFSLYALPPDTSDVRMFLLPLAVAVLALAALGVGVWAARRK